MTIIFFTPHHFYETIMTKRNNNHIYNIKNNFLLERQEIAVIPLVKVVRGGDFYNRLTH